MHNVACEFARAAVRSKDAHKQLARTSLSNDLFQNQLEVNQNLLDSCTWLEITPMEIAP